MPPVPVLPSADLSALAAAASPPAREPLPALPPADVARLLAPNADGVIDLAAASQADEADRLPNPFRRRWRPASAARDVPVAIGAVLTGDDPGDASVVINGRVCSRGDTLEGLAIAAITAEAIELRAGAYRARIPVRDAPIVLRLPR